jgi:DNA helicase HerA-like ATPase
MVIASEASDGVTSDTESRQAVWSIDGRSFRLRADASAAWRIGDYLSVTDGSGSRRLGMLETVDPVTETGIAGSGTLFEVGGQQSSQPFRTFELSKSQSTAIQDFYRSASLGMGSLLAAPDVMAGLMPAKLNRHTFWCGQSGSGKTYALGVALERILVQTRLPIVIFDANSDFVRLNTPRDDADPGEAAALMSRDIRVLRPGDGKDSLRIRFRDMSAQVRAALIRLDPLVDRAEYNALLRTRDIAAPFEDPRELSPFLRSLNDAGYTALAERLENLGVLNWQIWAGDRTAATEIIAERPAATVLDLGSFTDREEQLAVALGVLSDLWARREERRPVLLVIDEAHNLCSPDLESVAGRAVRDLIISIAAEGRKYGLWLLISTQRPGKVHRGIVSQCDNLTLMRMNSPNDLDDLADLFGFVPRAMLAQSSRFRQGEALLAGGFVPAPSLLKVRDRLTQEGGIDVRVPMPD